MKRLAFVLVLVPLVLYSGSASAALIGQWTFEGDNPLADTLGNWADLQLQGNAAIVGGQLDVNGSGTTPTGWAVTTGNGYAAGAITNKSLVAWVTLQGLSATASQGSAITIDSISFDNFDGIIFSEDQTDRWQNGSSNGSRNTPFVPGYQETTTGSMILMVITYQDLGGGNVRITGYRNGSQIGQYDDSPLGSWGPLDNEIVLGARHTLPGVIRGGLDALIEEARVYNHVLSPQEIQGLSPFHPRSIPTLGEWGIGLFALLSGVIAVYYLRKQYAA